MTPFEAAPFIAGRDACWWISLAAGLVDEPTTAHSPLNLDDFDIPPFLEL
jgi:hypothetical protein